MSRICYIYREKEKKEKSIELVFDTVAKELDYPELRIEKWYKPVGWKETFRQIRQIRKQKYDLYHITGDVNYLWMFLPWRRTTMTIHDIGMYKNNPKTLKRRLFALVSFYLPLLFLRKVSCVSELTRHDLVTLLGANPDKIEVIPNPIVLNISPAPKKFNTEKPVILQIGTGWHKNLDTLVESIQGLPCHLEIIGKPDQSIIDRMVELEISHNVSSNLSDDEVIKKYREADVLFFVSRSEGFGLPILEAQAMGRPVLTSATEPTASVAGGGGFLCSPDNPEEIHSALCKIINDPALRDKLINCGFENIKRFQPSEIAKKYRTFYSNHYKI